MCRHRERYNRILCWNLIHVHNPAFINLNITRHSKLRTRFKYHLFLGREGSKSANNSAFGGFDEEEHPIFLILRILFFDKHKITFMKFFACSLDCEQLVKECQIIRVP